MDGLWIGGASLVGLVIILFMGYFNNRKLDQIHVLVNSRLTDALKKIGDLKAHIETITGKPVPESMDGAD